MMLWRRCLTPLMSQSVLSLMAASDLTISDGLAMSDDLTISDGRI
jgi:hypothetical protein